MPLRIKASALGMSIIISLLIALLCGFFVMRSHLVQIEERRYDRLERLIKNSESGIQYLLSNNSGLQEKEELVIDLYDEQRDSVLLGKTSWGVYEIIYSKAFYQEKFRIKQAIVGAGQFSQDNRIGLYLTDTDKPLKVCGNTQLWGQTYISDYPIKRTSIEGQNYEGEKLIYGSQNKSAKILPPLNDELLRSLQNKLIGQFSFNDSLVSIFQTVKYAF